MSILAYPSEILLKTTKKVETYDSELEDIVKIMKKELNFTTGVGLAANQIGIDRQIFIYKYGINEGVVINPKITKNGKLILEQEGCLSLKGITAPTLRNEIVILEGYNLKREKIKIKAKNYLARIFQHEVDHLNGKLYIDRLQKYKREELVKQYLENSK